MEAACLVCLVLRSTHPYSQLLETFTLTSVFANAHDPQAGTARANGNAASMTPSRGGDDVDSEGEDADGVKEDPLVAIARDFPGWTVDDHLKVSCCCCGGFGLVWFS